MALDPWAYAEKTRTEHAEQVALFMWANMAEKFGLMAANDPLSYTVKGHALAYGTWRNDLVPQLKWLHAIHNQGHGDAIRGSRAKAEGVKPGVYDVFLPVPLGDERGNFYSGLYVELKRKDAGKASGEQNEFGRDMLAAGYQAEVCHGWGLVRDAILRYLGVS